MELEKILRNCRKYTIIYLVVCFLGVVFIFASNYLDPSRGLVPSVVAFVFSFIAFPLIMFYLGDKFSSRQPVVGKCGIVRDALSPRGTVVIEGHVVMAISIDGKEIDEKEKVIIDSFKDGVFYVAKIEGTSINIPQP